MIPKVRQWLVTTEAGSKYIVLAPTRYLALLNFRQDISRTAVKSISPVRNRRTQPEGARYAWKDNA